ncbi:hypothetical protein ACTSKR_13065 [Chitinibacteraceae bacterium HSL-7]
MSIWIRRLATVLPLIAVAYFAWQAWGPSGQQQTVRTPCASLVSGCSVVLNGETIRLHVAEAPQKNRPFVLISTSSRSALSAEWRMAGMDMPPARFRFTPSATGQQTQTALPVCSAARSDWILRLESNGQVAELALQL